MLTRVDGKSPGKSPVEYQDDDERRLVRELTIRLIRHPVSALDKILKQISLTLKEHHA